MAEGAAQLLTERLGGAAEIVTQRLPHCASAGLLEAICSSWRRPSLLRNCSAVVDAGAHRVQSGGRWRRRCPLLAGPLAPPCIGHGRCRWRGRWRSASWRRDGRACPYLRAGRRASQSSRMPSGHAARPNALSNATHRCVRARRLVSARRTRPPRSAPTGPPPRAVAHKPEPERPHGAASLVIQTHAPQGSTFMSLVLITSTRSTPIRGVWSIIGYVNETQ